MFKFRSKVTSVFLGAAIALCVPVAAHANLIFNPGNELPLVSGEIQGWTEVVGTDWAQRSAAPTPASGSFYFFAGASANGTLRQNVNVSSLATAIDAGLVAFDFSGYVQTFAQAPSDTARIVLRQLAADFSVLSTFDTGELINEGSWRLVANTSNASASTRFVQIDLIARRTNGNNNDGYFDDLGLTARVASVPVPPTYLLLAIAGGFGCLVKRRRG
jgi:hypothetical protein